MTRDKITEYDAVAANNLVIGDVRTSEAMMPSEVNDAIRELASHLKEFSAGTSGVDVLKFQDDDDSHSIKLQAPATVASDVIFTLPSTDGTSGQVLTTNGSSTLSFQDVTETDPSALAFAIALG